MRIPQPTASRHLAYLRKCELVVTRRAGPWTYYALAAARGTLHRQLVGCLGTCAGDVPELRADARRAATRLAIANRCTPNASPAAGDRKATVSNAKPILLVLCTGNSCRSQMAEGFLRRYLGDRYAVHSAGTEPADGVHPLAVRVMTEAGIDLAGQSPKGIERYLGRESVRHLLIVCDGANLTCPRIWPGTFTRTFMPFEDPAKFEGTPEQALAKFRAVRDEIAAAMRDWNPETAEAQSAIRHGA